MLTRDKASDCDGKQPFESERMANVAIRAMESRHVKNPKRAYKCPHCKKWHLGGAHNKNYWKRAKR